MTSTLIEAPVGATKIAARAATSGGRLAMNAGEGLIHRVQPGYIPPEIVAQQAVLKRFEHRLSIVDLIDTGTSEGELTDRAYGTVDTLVEESLVDQRTAVELHPVLPEDALWNPALNERREKALQVLQLAFEEDNIMALPYSHPIMPSAHEDSPIDIEATWRAFAPELYGLSRQFRSDGEYEPAMLAITSPAYEQALFWGKAAITGESGNGTFLVLEKVGRLPKDNSLARVS